jgi:hypothetical protein
MKRLLTYLQVIEAYKMYSEQKISTIEIGKYFKCSADTIRKEFKRANLFTRDKAINSIGKIYNNILVISCYRENGRTYFNCICFCKKTFTVRAESIKDNTTKSCGCSIGLFAAQASHKPDNQNQINSLFRCYKRNAQTRDLPFEIQLDDFLKIIALNCHYCNVIPKQEWVANRKRKNYFGQPVIYNGIDRVNSNIGYTMLNSVAACFICNAGKNKMTYENFMQWIKCIVKFQKEQFNRNEKYQFYLKQFENKIDIFDKIETVLETNVIINKTYGYLTVIEKDAADPKAGYKCLCICNKIVYKDKYYLLNGRPKSCGCKRGFLLSVKHTKPNSEAQFNNIFTQYKGGAKIRNLNFLLSFDEFKSIITENCYYCGEPPHIYNIRGRSSKAAKNYNIVPIYHNGIDRIDSKQGYSIENCVPCCKNCNRVKSDLTYNEFIEYIDRLLVKYYNQLKE